jgi:hypothetical protein
LLVPRRRAEQALTTVIGQAYIEGVSTRRVDDLVKAMGIKGISKSQVSRMAAEFDAKVAEFRDRPLDAGPYRYLWIDALTQKVREGGRVVNVSAVIATAVTCEGRREIIGFDIVTTESTASWTAFLRSLVARGLAGVELVISDAHGGIKAAIAAVLAESSWQRCRTHFMANLATRIPKGDWPMIATLVRTIFEQPDRDATWEQLGDVVDKLTQAGFVDTAVVLLDAADDILAFSAFPVEHWPKIRSNNPQERLNKEIRRRTNVVGIFPNRPAVIAWSAPCSPNRPTSGPSPSATCPPRPLRHPATKPPPPPTPGPRSTRPPADRPQLRDRHRSTRQVATGYTRTPKTPTNIDRKRCFTSPTDRDNNHPRVAGQPSTQVDEKTVAPDALVHYHAGLNRRTTSRRRR